MFSLFAFLVEMNFKVWGWNSQWQNTTGDENGGA
jgi:cell shape-determining protein MreD